LRQGNLCNCLFFSALSKTHFGQQDNTYTVWKNNVKKSKQEPFVCWFTYSCYSCRACSKDWNNRIQKVPYINIKKFY